MFPKIDKSKIDDMHFDSYAQKMMSYSKPKMLCLSPRELGKSTWWWLFAYKNAVEKGYTSIVFKYIQADLMDVTIDDIVGLLNKFLVEPVDIYYKRTFKDGIVDVELVGTEGEKIPFVRFVCINLPLRRLKSLFYPNLRWMCFDEYMLDTRTANETYPDQVVFKLNEIFKTFNRECDGKLRMWFLGNPYSRYAPVHNFVGVNSGKLEIGKYIVGEDYVASVIPLPQKLIDYITERDKNYKFAESYLMYSVFGHSVNDEQIRLKDRVIGYILRYVFYVEGKKLLVFRNNNDVVDSNNIYWVCIDNDYKSENRNIITFDYNSLVDGTILLGNEEKKYFRILKNAFRYRKIEFKDVESSYLFEQIFMNI